MLMTEGISTKIYFHQLKFHLHVVFVELMQLLCCVLDQSSAVKYFDREAKKGTKQ